MLRSVLAQEALDPASTWMIGDRAADVTGGRANGLRTIGVRWGYGSDDALRDAEPGAGIGSMTELLDHVRAHA